MPTLHRKMRRVSTTLLREATDWGMSVSEKKVRMSWLNATLLILSSVALFLGLMFGLPLLIVVVMSAEVGWLGAQIMVALGLVALSLILILQSRKGPRNAFELDRQAGELRLGMHNRYGAFVRKKVLPLRQVVAATVAVDREGKPQLTIVLDDAQERITLADAKEVRLEQIAEQIGDAAAEARSMPRRSRIEQSVASFGAHGREISRRVSSRVLR